MAKVVTHNWHLFDASGQVVGRFSTHISNVLRGKFKPTFTGNKDCGDTVVIINAEKAVFTGKKWEQKVYYKHSGYIGGLAETKASHLRERYPERVLLHSIRGMIPKTVHRLPQLKRLYVYAGHDHPFKHMFPNAPPAPKVEKKSAEKMVEHFKVLDEYLETVEKNLIPVEPQANGAVNPVNWLKQHQPEEFAEFMAKQEIRLSPQEYEQYLTTKARLALQVSADKKLGHSVAMNQKYGFGIDKFKNSV